MNNDIKDIVERGDLKALADRYGIDENTMLDAEDIILMKNLDIENLCKFMRDTIIAIIWGLYLNTPCSAFDEFKDKVEEEYNENK